MNYLGNDWYALRRWLKDEQLNTYQRLVSINNTEDETQRLRGRALLIDQLLDFPNNPTAWGPLKEY